MTLKTEMVRLAVRGPGPNNGHETGDSMRAKKNLLAKSKGNTEKPTMQTDTSSKVTLV
jgi:hypothetical protein